MMGYLTLGAWLAAVAGMILIQRRMRLTAMLILQHYREAMDKGLEVAQSHPDGLRIVGELREMQERHLAALLSQRKFRRVK